MLQLDHIATQLGSLPWNSLHVPHLCNERSKGDHPLQDESLSVDDRYIEISLVKVKRIKLDKILMAVIVQAEANA